MEEDRNPWEECGYSKEKWESFGEKTRATLLNNARKKATAAEGGPRVVGVTGSKAETVAAYVGQLISDVDIALSLLKSVKDGQGLLAMCTMIMNYADRNLDFSRIDGETVKKLYRLRNQELAARIRSQRTKHEPVTPFNYTSVLLGHPAIKTTKLENNECLYNVGGTLYRLPMNSNAKAFDVAKIMIKAALGSISGKEHELCEYDVYAEMLTRQIMLNYAVRKTEFGLIFGQKAPAPPPQTITADNISDVSPLLDALDDVIRPWIEKEWSVNSCDSDSIMSVLYSGILQYKWHQHPDLRDWLVILYDKYAPLLEVKTHLTAEEKENWIRKIKVDKGMQENILAETKGGLDNSRPWRDRFPELNKHSHDWFVGADYQHVTDQQWGAAHSAQLFFDLMENETEKSYSLLEFVGDKAVNAAAALDFLQEQNPELLKCVDYFATAKRCMGAGGVKAVRNWTVVPVYENAVTSPGMSYGDGKRFFMVTQFLERGKGVEIDQHITRLIGEFKAQKQPWKMALNTHYMTSEKFNRILELCEKENCGVNLWKHPRLHNDSIYIIVYSNGKPTGEVVSQYFSYMKMTLVNNSSRDLALFVGIKPKRDEKTWDKNVLFGMFGAIHVKEFGKSTSVKLRTSAFGADSISYRLLTEQGFGLGKGNPVTGDKGNNNNEGKTPEPKEGAKEPDPFEEEEEEEGMEGEEKSSRKPPAKKSSKPGAKKATTGEGVKRRKT